VRVYYTTDGTEPTTNSASWSYTTNFSENINFTKGQQGLAVGTYNIKASAKNSLGWSDLSDMATFTIECQDPAPTTPNITMSPSVICTGSTAELLINNYAENLKYTLYKVNGETVVEEKTLETYTEGEITKAKYSGFKKSGNYMIKATNPCEIEATSQTVSLTVIDGNAVSIEPATATTNPWVPVEFTVTSNNTLPYTLQYLDANDKDVTADMVVVKNGNSYSVKIPRPDGEYTDVEWGYSNDSKGETSYTVKVSQESAGVTCGSNTQLNITLQDTFDDCD
jgi:hypothetical protein